MYVCFDVIELLGEFTILFEITKIRCHLHFFWPCHQNAIKLHVNLSMTLVIFKNTHPLPIFLKKLNIIQFVSRKI